MKYIFLAFAILVAVESQAATTSEQMSSEDLYRKSLDALEQLDCLTAIEYLTAYKIKNANKISENKQFFNLIETKIQGCKQLEQEKKRYHPPAAGSTRTRIGGGTR